MLKFSLLSPEYSIMFDAFGYVKVFNSNPEKFSAIVLRLQFEQFIAEGLF